MPTDFAAITLTPLQPSDFTALAAVARQIWREHYSTIITPQQIDYMLEGRFTPANLSRYLQSDDRWMYVLRRADDVIGYCSFARTQTPGEMKLEQLYLLPALHGRGLGKHMLEHVEQEARAHGCEVLMLQVNKQNEKSIDVYRRGGFTVREEVVVDIGNGFVMDDYIMAKPLRPPLSSEARS